MSETKVNGETGVTSSLKVTLSTVTAVPAAPLRLAATHRVLTAGESQEPKYVVTLRDLYPALESRHSVLGGAIRLLTEALQFVDEASVSLRGDDLTRSDDALLRIRALLPELFACRSLGDGFGMVVAALVVSFQRHPPEPFTLDEITAVRAALQRLLDEPFMVEELAANTVDRLEDAGLDVVVAGIDRLVEEPGG